MELPHITISIFEHGLIAGAPELITPTWVRMQAGPSGELSAPAPIVGWVTVVDHTRRRPLIVAVDVDDATTPETVEEAHRRSRRRWRSEVNADLIDAAQVALSRIREAVPA